MMTRICIIGGGSYTWGPIFLHEIFTNPELQDAVVVLEDTNPDRQDLVYKLGEKMRGELGAGTRLERTISLEDALTGADFIILTITTGALEAMRSDLEIPARYGIRQSVGDTTGPGGLSRSLRNIPVVREISRRVVEICPDALFLNYTNPMSTLTRTLAMGGVRVVGLCHEWPGVRNRLATLLKVEPGQTTARIAGINHLIWATGLWADGRDLWPEIPTIAQGLLSGKLHLDPDDTSVFIDSGKAKARLFQLYGALPVAGDRHLTEFFPQFIRESTGWGADYGFRLTSVGDRQGLAAYAQSTIEAALNSEDPIGPILDLLPKEAAAEIISGVITSAGYTGIMNLPNTGQITNLPLDVVVETFGTIDHTGATAQAFGDLPPGVAAICERHIRNQEMTVQAALVGDRNLALQVLLNDPLSSCLTVDQAEAMLGDLLEANRPYLPQFFPD